VISVAAIPRSVCAGRARRKRIGEILETPAISKPRKALRVKSRRGYSLQGAACWNFGVFGTARPSYLRPISTLRRRLVSPSEPRNNRRRLAE